ncbi:MAG TPA: acyl-CoA dehydrogenase family protein [Rhodothermales bacterium]|nr:acyl-CoA dehydrogenase family protein [Rhodothermales bacterium]
MSAPGLSKLKNVSAQDQKMIEDIEVMLGPEPSEMGFVKNLFWGHVREDLIFPYPEESKAERRRCDVLLKELDAYLKTEHPAVLIDQEQYIPDWVIRKLFDMGVMGMTVPKEYGGLGLGVTSYNRVLELIGRYCSSTAVVVSAHQSIGCKAIMLFGTKDQKDRFLPGVAREYLSAFCLSEPNVGSDASGQQTTIEKTPEGDYILNGEKKWSTSAALSGVLTVMGKQKIVDPKTGKEKEAVTALICTTDTPGIEIFQKNRSKTGIRGTWQGRVRFTNVRVPKENLLYKEGKGLNVALTCLNYGRCTLSAGVSGAARYAMEQGAKFVQTRYQFDRPLADFELVRQKIAAASAYTYAMDAMLYMVTGMLDRHDSDIMVETAAAKLFCSHFGWQVIDDMLQIMGGEAYMTENGYERLWRDNRIHRIVEGSNEVMESFIFAYGGKQVAEQMIGIRDAFSWNRDETAGQNLSRIIGSALDSRIVKRAVPLGLQLFLNVRPPVPELTRVLPDLQSYAGRFARLVQQHAYYFKQVSKWHREEIIQRQVVQARVADNAVYLFAMACTLSKMDMQLRNNEHGAAFERDKAAFEHFFDLAEIGILQNIHGLKQNADDSMRRAAEAALNYTETLPNSDFFIHEASPVAAGTGRPTPTDHIKQFPGEGASEPGGDGHPGRANVNVNPPRKRTSKPSEGER